MKNSLANYNPMLLCDFYKLSHRSQYPIGTNKVYSTWTCRGSRMTGVDKTLFFGLQKFIKEYLIDYFNVNFFDRPIEEVEADYVRTIKYTLGDNNPETEHIKELHKLGYLPIRIKAFEEGTLIPVRVPSLTIENTEPQFFWITNFLETLMSCELWQSITSATIALEYRKIVEQFADETVGNSDHVGFQCHDFSMRGMSSVSSAINSGIGHLVSFTGTDTVPAILALEKYYNADVEKELVAGSVAATEHSVMCSYGQTDELELFRHLIEDVYPNGIFSVVSDTWDLWKVLTEYLPQLKEKIISRDGKVVIRPDSGNPVDILCGKVKVIELSENELKGINNLKDLELYFKDVAWEDLSSEEKDEVSYFVRYEGKVYNLNYTAEWTTERGEYSDMKYYVLYEVKAYTEEYDLTPADKGVIQLLWEVFGGTINDKGYKVLDAHIGAIYGDSITLERCKLICEGLKANGFASSNIVFGVGSYSYQMCTRDTFCQALKATYAEVNGEKRLLFKNPVTDDGTKKSQKGMIFAYKENGEITYKDGYDKDTIADVDGENLLQDVFVNGKLVRDESLAVIRERVNKYIENEVI